MALCLNLDYSRVLCRIQYRVDGPEQAFLIRQGASRLSTKIIYISDCVNLVHV